MIIGLVGPAYSGKSTISEYLVSHAFETLRIVQDTEESLGVNEFNSAAAVLDHVICKWKNNFVLTGIEYASDWKLLLKRPFFLLIAVDCPLLVRFRRTKYLSLEEFVQHDDQQMYHTATAKKDIIGGMVGLSLSHTSLFSIMHHAHVKILNICDSVEKLYEYLDAIDLLNHERLRPSWDAYFMKLCDLAASRSNCMVTSYLILGMKRRVGCILVKGRRIIATGYNGTPKGLRNCNDGGCKRCNSNAPCGTSLDMCLCLHAEENALLEAGRERVESGSSVTLYCNTCPCLGCAKKIVQIGVKEVVYSRAYGMDISTEYILQEAGVKLRQFSLIESLQIAE